ncbi:MAG: hypothetical protein RL173_1201 [Fibrobacterota bacterium]|jgi:hypothetical protein
MSHPKSMLLGIVVACTQIFASTYYADAINGKDSAAGSFALPVKTLAKAMTLVKSGDTVLLQSGNYGDFGFGRTGTDPKTSWAWRPIPEVFSDWVTIAAAPQAKAHLGNVSLGTWNHDTGWAMSFAQKGNSDLRLRLERLNIDDGIRIEGSRHIEIKHNTIRLMGDTISIMGRAGVTVLNGQFVSIDSNEITHCGLGIQGMTRDFVVRGNEIHHNSHDGISILGGENWLVEGNRIHDLDDGANDDDQKSGAKPWNMHVDGIHMYMVNGGNAKYATDSKNFTFRNNIFYHLEAMGVMINANNAGGEYRDFTWENNIWGPVGGIGFHLGADFEGKFVFRNNTFASAPNDVWTSIFGRVMNEHSYSLALWAKPSGSTAIYEFYNNIFAQQVTIPPYDYVAKNIHFTGKDAKMDRDQIQVKDLPYATISGSIVDYVESGRILGAPVRKGPAVDSGVSRSPLRDDAYGLPRDASVDIGAVEYHAGSWMNPRITNTSKYGTGILNSSFDALGRTSRPTIWLEKPLVQ